MKVITLPNGHAVSLRCYVDSWKILLTLPPSQQVTGWSWYPESAGEILRNISFGVHDRINQRGQLAQGKPTTVARLNRHLARTVQCECRWCGSPLLEYRPHHDRFCSPACRRDFAS